VRTLLAIIGYTDEIGNRARIIKARDWKKCFSIADGGDED
jgi:hypothetical protein